MIASIKTWWHTNVQKTMGYLGTLIIGVDLSGYAEPIKAFVGQKGYYALVLLILVVTTIRAHQKPAPTLPAPVAR